MRMGPVDVRSSLMENEDMNPASCGDCSSLEIRLDMPVIVRHDPFKYDIRSLYPTIEEWDSEAKREKSVGYRSQAKAANERRLELVRRLSFSLSRCASLM